MVHASRRSCNTQHFVSLKKTAGNIWGYAIAHEVGHHVQKLLRIADKVDTLRSRVGESRGNRLSVMLELQADCLAGVWAYHADRSRGILEQGDIEEALNAASAIGDDRLQHQS